MVRFYCDRCNTEVEGPDDLVEVVIEGRERPNLSAWGWRSEMCRSCYDGFKDSIQSLVDANDDSRRKSARRTSS